MRQFSFVGWALIMLFLSVIAGALITYLSSISAWIQAVTHS